MDYVLTNQTYNKINKKKNKQKNMLLYVFQKQIYSEYNSFKEG